MISTPFTLSAGWLGPRDPRAKLGLSLFLLGSAIIANRPLPLLALLLLIHLLALTARIPPRTLAGAWRGMLPITLLILLLGSFTWGAPGAAWAEIGPFRATPDTVEVALTLAARLNVLAFSLLLLLWTTDSAALVAGLGRLGFPYGASLTLAIALQFVPTLGRTFSEIAEAQAARGLIIPRNPLRAARAYLPLLVPLLITALRTADNLSMALVSRGYRAGVPRSSRRILRMAGADWAILLAGAALAAASLALRLLSS